MTTTTPQNRPLVSKVLVHAPDCDAFCVARLRIVHGRTVADGQTANQASILLSITTALANSISIANLSSRSQVLTLNIPPERVEKCGFARRSNTSLCPARLLSSLPAPVTNVSAVSTLSLSLGTVGIVLSPAGMDSLKPAVPGDLEFHSFAKICQSKFFRLHFTGRQFVNNELDKLRDFSHALRQRSLQAVPLNTARHGVWETDWRVFALSPDPPPYCQESVSEQVDPPVYKEVLGKRCRDPRSISPNTEKRKRLHPLPPPPIGSPTEVPTDIATEVDTPSTRAPSRSPSSIRMTHFQRASSRGQTEYQRLAHLEHELRGVSDDLIRRLLIRTGRAHLLAVPEDVDRRLGLELEPVGSSPETDMVMLGRRLERYIDKTVERRLAHYVDYTVAECRDQLHDVCNQKQAQCEEEIDNGNVEVRNTANDCMKEMEEQVQGYMVQMEEQAQRCMKDIEDRGVEIAIDIESDISAKIKLSPRSDASAQLDGKSSARHGLRAGIRRSSV
ncbi:hypothetical protein BO86DRAFT_320020 [Aspergillus japonicus CBS 114.51]|uniref:Uncharacterized protein n=1 Tax=Aspergillus japonicus CBS 114.51 TaxID=1448312 RepID=A0A8T8WSN9_ASPJA|nr:hypothetical protein BO86DRAFT_320020 [Aspergillus japonicus CBS 114.51]RAH78811.1 hypothetical protein BO86DRAFT_320020 [Aspergillus japonicus CBS 114.51]